MKVAGANFDLLNLPRSFPIETFLSKTDWAGVAPRQTSTCGRISSTSADNQGLQAAISLASGR
ncbi:MAG TPA: hypothetical protein VGR30_10495 [Candidatus Binatia bacterium]|nr:hypothetical protein [Candidatus Binatia bacterium]